MACIVITETIDDHKHVASVQNHLMLTTAGKNRARFHLYVVTLACQTGSSIILPLVPFVNDVLHTTDVQYSLTFSGYYLTTIISIARYNC